RPTTDEDLRRISGEAAGRTVSIKLDSNSTVWVGGLHPEGGRLAWTSPAPGSASADELHEVTIVSRGKGFWEGAAFGAGAGFLTGLALGVIWNTNCSAGPYVDNEQSSSCPWTTNPSLSGGLQLGSILGLMFAIPGAVVGGIVGGVRGDRTTFAMQP